MSELTRRHDATARTASGEVPSRAALLIAHPGHELRVHHWLERARPLVLVLTQGDGHDRTSRLDSTTRVIEAAGAQPGSIYGRWRDRDLYDALRQGDVGVMTAALDDITQALLDADIDVIVADAEERYNPSHDVCRYLASAAAARVRRATSRAVVDLEFPLVGPPASLHHRDDPHAVIVELDDEALTRKLAAASAYPELAAEVEHAVAAFGRRAFGAEFLTAARVSPLDSTEVPFYETYGAAQVAAGRYPDLITYEGHLRPVRTALGLAAACGS